MVAFRPYLLSLFTLQNPDSITKTISVKDLVFALQCTPRFDEIVVHLRMDDFLSAGKDHTSLILHPNYFQEVLSKARLQYSLPIRIVFDQKNNPKEDAYLNQFLPYSPIFQSADLVMDFATLVKARVLVSSNSTFAWMAGFLAEDQKRYLPTISHVANQTLGKIEESDEVKESFFITL